MPQSLGDVEQRTTSYDSIATRYSMVTMLSSAVKRQDLGIPLKYFR